MSAPNPYQPPDASVATNSQHDMGVEHAHLQGLRGWLILVAIGIVLSPFKILALVYTTYIKYIYARHLGGDHYSRHGSV